MIVAVGSESVCCVCNCLRGRDEPYVDMKYDTGVVLRRYLCEECGVEVQEDMVEAAEREDYLELEGGPSDQVSDESDD